LRLFNVSELDFMKVRDNPEAFERYKDELIGSIVKVIGRARRNPMSNDIDFISNLVFPNPNPEEEMKLLK
jgi:hypothetical protein